MPLQFLAYLSTLTHTHIKRLKTSPHVGKIITEMLIYWEETPELLINLILQKNFSAWKILKTVVNVVDPSDYAPRSLRSKSFTPATSNL